MEQKEAENYIKAGKILKEVMEKAKKELSVGQKLLEIAEKLEKEIISLHGRPAFPVNLSINENAAHFTPNAEDSSTIGKEDVVKVDIGVQVDGYIADAAFTVDFSGKYGKMVEAAEEAKENAVKVIKEGVEVGEIGKVIQETIKSYGFGPIQNLSGHRLLRWTTHAEPSIPNIGKKDERELEEGMCVAVEPFVTTGSGFVKEAVQSEIFAIDEPKPVRHPAARKILEFVSENYETLPFAERWIVREMKLSEFERKIGLKELLRSSCIRAFPILKEEKGAIVTQAETSVLLHDGKAVRLV